MIHANAIDVVPLVVLGAWLLSRPFQRWLEDDDLRSIDQRGAEQDALDRIYRRRATREMRDVR